MRFEGPASGYEALVAAARRAGLELDDYAVDTTGAYGWPMLGNGRAAVIVVIDDDVWAPDDVASTLRAAHERCTGAAGDWIVAAGSFVYLPDGLPPEWYEEPVRLAEALHEAEAVGDPMAVRGLRAEVAAVVAAALPVADVAFARFREAARRLAPGA